MVTLDGEHQFHSLHRIWLKLQECGDANKPKELRKIAGQIADPAGLPDTFEEALPNLLPRLAGPFDADLSALTGGEPVATQSLTGLPTLFLIWDAPDSIHYVSPQVLESWGLEVDKAFDVALDNLRRIGAPEFQDWGDGVYVCNLGDLHDATPLRLTDFFQRLPFDGASVAVAPCRTAITITDAQNQAGLTKLAELAADFYESELPLYPGPLLLKDGAWTLLDVPAPSNAATFGQLTRGYWKELFNAQQAHLDDRFVEEDDALYVFGTHVFTHEARPEGAPMTTWTDGIEILLPEVEFIGFISDEIREREELVLVPWSLVLEEPGEMIVPTDYRPPRHRIGSLPPQETIDALFARSPKWWLD